jgi:hypothetical protein
MNSLFSISSGEKSLVPLGIEGLLDIAYKIKYNSIKTKEYTKGRKEKGDPELLLNKRY